MYTIAVDFDGVIHAYSRGWHDGTIYDPPLPGAIDAVHTLLDTYAVYIHTSRSASQVVNWMRHHSDRIYVTDYDLDSQPKFWNTSDRILVTNRKLPAVAYLDDRAIRFIDWSHALVTISSLYAMGDL